MASLDEMRDEASPELNIMIYSGFTISGLALTGISEVVYFEAEHSSYLQALVLGGLILAANYGQKLVREIIHLRHTEDS